MIDRRYEHINILIHGAYKNIHTECTLECTVCNHTWVGRIGNRANTFNRTGRNGCPECCKLQTSERKTDTNYIDQFDDMGITVLEPYKGSKQHHLLKCHHCDHQWSATLVSCVQAYKNRGTNNCPNCNILRRLDRNTHVRDRALRLMERVGVVSIDDRYKGEQTTTQKFRFKNVHCGHVFETAPGNILHNNVTCPICGKDSRAQQNRERNRERSETWRATAPDRDRYRSEVESITRATISQFSAELNPHNKCVGIAGTAGAYQYDHIYACNLGFANNVPPELMGSVENLQLIPWEVNSFLSNKPRPFIPTHVATYLGIRVPVQELMDELGGCKLITDLKVLTAFEYNKIGVVFCNKDTHIAGLNAMSPKDKFKVREERLAMVESMRFNQTVVVFEDEWNTNPNLVTSKIKHLAGASAVKRKVHARKCSVRVINVSEKKEFLNRNHLQGDDTASVALGAYNGDQLVAVMTFCKPRVLMNKNIRSIPSDTWELSRFATDVNVRVPGIAGKLLQHFKRNYVWRQVYSFADGRWSRGNVYTKLGFRCEKVNPPGYWYVDGIGNRWHRWKFRKDNMKHMEGYDPNVTEYENVMQLYGYHRLYDCGTIKYVLSNEDYEDVR